MKRISFVILVLVLVPGAFLAGTLYTKRPADVNSVRSVRKVLYYVDPMHPAYKSDKPGIAPDCGMELVPVYADGSMGDSEGNPASRRPPGTVHVSAETQHALGVRLEAVQRSGGTHHTRLLGCVAADERRVYFLNSATDGWIQETFAHSTGSLVQKDEVLATCYAPEFLGAEQAYFYALNALDRFRAAGQETSEQVAITKVSVKQAADTLRNLGMGDVQIQALERERRITETIEIRSPATGFILERNVSPGLRFERGKQLYRIADLSRIWVLADTYENEAQHLKPGTVVKASVPNQQRMFHAKVTHILPQFDGTTRTLKVRLEADNPGYFLRPDMFVDLEVPVTREAAIVVPVDAVVDSGTKKTVYVAKGDGVFEPRKVETGWRAGDQVEIVKGLMVGEQIVVSGTFLLDSESRMKAAAAGIYGESSECPVCGMEVDHAKAKAAGLTSVFGGQTYYFCVAEDKAKFDAQPTKYTLKSNPGPTTTTGKSLEQVEWQGAKSREPKRHEHPRASLEGAPAQ
jgi:RND family efflux transporter MFP subunit